MRRGAWCGVLLLWLGSAACERESRRYKELPASESRPGQIAISALEPGGPTQRTPVLSPYQENAWGIGEGKRLYSAYNCNGCHAQGGGGIGPPLMDAAWIYGSAPDQIYSTIAQGRPNGMPAFGSRVPAQQLWQLVAYVQALSVQVPRDASTSRNDDLNGIKPELRLEPQPPRWTGHR
jgi:cytochrome c oxidase cbb3-type subunit III